MSPQIAPRPGERQRRLVYADYWQGLLSPNMAQTLARHSDIRRTLGVYTHVDLQDQTAANGALPGPPAPPTIAAVRMKAPRPAV